MLYNSKMKIESNCIGYAFYTLGLIAKERVKSTGYWEDLIEPHFREVGKLKDARALAVVRKAPDYLVLHMMVVDRSNPFWVFHRPDMGVPVVHEQLFRALDYYWKECDEGPLRVAKLALLHGK